MKILTSELEKELQALDPRLAIIVNPRRPAGDGNAQGISNVKLDGVDVCPVPSTEISDEPDQNMRYTFPNGMNPRFKSRQEVLAIVKDMLEKLKIPEFKEIFFDKDK
jgi:hypothetical protein